MSDNQAKVAPVTEILGAMLSASDLSVADFKSDPRHYIDSRFGVNVDDNCNLNVCENTAQEVHVALPFYSTMDAVSAEVISDEDVGSAVGGEIIITVLSITAVAATAGAVGYGAYRAIDATQTHLQENPK